MDHGSLCCLVDFGVCSSRATKPDVIPLTLNVLQLETKSQLYIISCREASNLTLWYR